MAMQPATGKGQMRLLLILGCSALLGGVALAVLPRSMPQVADIARTLQKVGLTAGLSGAVGLVLLALSLVRGAQYQALTLAGEIRENTVIVEDVATEVASIGSCVASIQSECKGMTERAGELSRLIENQLEQLRSEAAQRDPHDAIFKLASSVDRLGARFEERFIANQEALEKSAHQWREALDDMRDSLDSIEGLLRKPAGAPAAAAEGGFEMLDRLDDQVQRESQSATLEALASEASTALDSSWLHEHAPTLPKIDPQQTNFTRRG